MLQPTRRLRPAARPSVLPRLEPLEDRATPAGVLNATFLDGTLKISGDAAANTLAVFQTADGRLTLTTDAGTTLKVNGTTVPGFPGHTLPTPVAGGVTIALGGGSDLLTFTGVTADINLPSSLAINLGDGGNILTIQDGVTVGGNLTVTNGVGFDTLHLFDELTVLGKLTISNGAGGSLLDGNAATELRVARAFAVISGTGFDQIDLTKAQVVAAGGLVLRTGADADGSNTDLSPVQSLTITGEVSVVNGAGNDDLDIGDPTLVTRITGPVGIANGAGTNHTDLFGTDRLDVGGPVFVVGGAGNDTTHLGLNSNLVSLGGVTVNAGAGSNVTGVAGTRLHVGGNLTVTGGAGQDEVDILPAQDGLVTGAVKVTLGAGLNLFEARPGNGDLLAIGKSLTFLSTSLAGSQNLIDLRGVRVQGATAITTGAGGDTVAFDDVAFVGPVTVNTAAGGDTVNVEQQQPWAGHTRFHQAVRIKTGAGDDTVRVSALVPEAERKAFFHGSATFDGGPDADTLQLVAGVNVFFGPPPVTTGF